MRLRCADGAQAHVAQWRACFGAGQRQEVGRGAPGALQQALALQQCAFSLAHGGQRRQRHPGLRVTARQHARQACSAPRGCASAEHGAMLPRERTGKRGGGPGAAATSTLPSSSRSTAPGGAPRPPRPRPRPNIASGALASGPHLTLRSPPPPVKMAGPDEPTDAEKVPVTVRAPGNRGLPARLPARLARCVLTPACSRSLRSRRRS